MASIKIPYPAANITLLEMDQLSLSSVVSATKLFLSNGTALHGLVNNADIMATPFETSKHGHEAQWQTNYLAHWIFTSHLLPLMLETSETLPPGSVRHREPVFLGVLFCTEGGINFADTSVPNGGVMTRYGQSKLANVPHTKTLSKHLASNMVPVHQLRRLETARFGPQPCILNRDVSFSSACAPQAESPASDQRSLQWLSLCGSLIREYIHDHLESHRPSDQFH